MPQKQMRVYLVVGILAGLFLTACAGVISGRIDVPVSGGPFGSSVNFLSPFETVQSTSHIGVRSEALIQREALVVFEMENFCHGGEH